MKPKRQLLQSRWVYRTLREVWLVEDRIVEKRFLHHPGRHDVRPVWAREDRALRRLEGLPVPRSLGCYREDHAGGKGYVLRKTYLEGTPLRAMKTKDAQDLARLMAAIHQRLVVINDPATGNFLRQPDGQLACIDFGRSRTFHWRTLYFYFYVGKELARLGHDAFHDEPELWAAFLTSYRQHGDVLDHQRWLIHASRRYWEWHIRRRHQDAGLGAPA